MRYHLACSVLRTIREWNMKKKHQQYSKVENVTKTLTSIGLKKVLENNENETLSRIQEGTHRSKWIVLGGNKKTNSSTTVSEKAGERKKRGRKRRRRCYQELEVTFKNER